MGESFIVRRSGGIGSASIPKFTYTGTYHMVTETDGNWHIEFLTSGTLIFTKVAKELEIFLCGGGASGGNRTNGSWPGYTVWKGGDGGAGGQTKTSSLSGIQTNYEYKITIGGSNGNTTAFGLSATGGGGKTGGIGGKDGGTNGASGSNGNYAFNDSTFFVQAFEQSGYRFGAGGGGGGGYTESNGAQLYLASKGGAGGLDGGGYGADNEDGIQGTYYPPTSGKNNSGGGGGGGGPVSTNMTGASGGSGIVIIRNVRGA